MAMREALSRLAAISPEAVAAGEPPPILPAYYDDVCRRRFIALRLQLPALAWPQVEPVFALAAASFDFQRRIGPEAALLAIAGHYETMRGESPLTWRHARVVLDAAWLALGHLQERHRAP